MGAMGALWLLCVPYGCYGCPMGAVCAGSLSSMPAVRTFALTAALSIAFDFLLQMSAFVALLSLDTRREEVWGGVPMGWVPIGWGCLWGVYRVHMGGVPKGWGCLWGAQNKIWGAQYGFRVSMGCPGWIYGTYGVP